MGEKIKIVEYSLSGDPDCSMLADLVAERWPDEVFKVSAFKREPVDEVLRCQGSRVLRLKKRFGFRPGGGVGGSGGRGAKSD